VAMGLVSSLSRPGGTMTGFAIISRNSMSNDWNSCERRFRKPPVSPSSTSPGSGGACVPRSTRRHASRVSQLTLLEVRAAADIEGAYATAVRERAAVVMPLASALLHAEKRRLVSLAAKHRLPTMYENRAFAEAGGLISYGPDVADVFRRAATYVDRILTGTGPADLPIQQPTKFELVLNLRTAKALGLTIPPSLLQRADQVIE
jgi:putative ABC transport system substrate-binding protein